METNISHSKTICVLVSGLAYQLKQSSAGTVIVESTKKIWKELCYSDSYKTVSFDTVIKSCYFAGKTGEYYSQHRIHQHREEKPNKTNSSMTTYE